MIALERKFPETHRYPVRPASCHRRRLSGVQAIEATFASNRRQTRHRTTDLCEAAGGCAAPQRPASARLPAPQSHPQRRVASHRKRPPPALSSRPAWVGSFGICVPSEPEAAPGASADMRNGAPCRRYPVSVVASWRRRCAGPRRVVATGWRRAGSGRRSVGAWQNFKGDSHAPGRRRCAASCRCGPVPRLRWRVLAAAHCGVATGAGPGCRGVTAAVGGAWGRG